MPICEITSLGWSLRFFSHRPNGVSTSAAQGAGSLVFVVLCRSSDLFILTIAVVINTFFSSSAFPCSLECHTVAWFSYQVIVYRVRSQQASKLLERITWCLRLAYFILPEYYTVYYPITRRATRRLASIEQTAQRLSARRWTTLWTTQNCTWNCPHRKVRRLERLKILSRQCPTRQHFCSEHVFSRSDRMERGQVSGGPAWFRNSPGKWKKDTDTRFSSYGCTGSAVKDTDAKWIL